MLTSPAVIPRSAATRNLLRFTSSKSPREQIPRFARDDRELTPRNGRDRIPCLGREGPHNIYLVIRLVLGDHEGKDGLAGSVEFELPPGEDRVLEVHFGHRRAD